MGPKRAEDSGPVVKSVGENDRRSGDEAASSRRSVPSRPSYAEGDVVAERYVLVRALAEGGMGSVWVAHNQSLEIDVAIKFIRADVEEDNAAGRLMQEARAAARLGHPAIVRIFEFGSSPRGDPFLAMELLEGEDLWDTITASGPFDVDKAVRTILPIAHALASAHAKGIVHRDIKPENIFLTHTADGLTQPKLLDFGIAKLDRGPDARLTTAGATLGSPAYMSPEQARGQEVDHRADIWALAVVLYEVVTARQPFEGANYNARLRAIIEDQPQPITGLGTGDGSLWAILSKGLAKDPAERWQTMREFGSALAAWLLERGVADDISGTSLQAAWRRATDAGPPSSRASGPPSGVTIERPATPSAQRAQVVIERRAPPAVVPAKSRSSSSGLRWVAIGGVGVALAAGAFWVLRGGGASLAASTANASREVSASVSAAPVVAPRGTAAAVASPPPTAAAAAEATTGSPAASEEASQVKPTAPATRSRAAAAPRRAGAVPAKATATPAPALEPLKEPTF